MAVERTLAADEQHVANLPALDEGQGALPAPVAGWVEKLARGVVRHHPGVDHQQRAGLVEPAAYFRRGRSGSAEDAGANRVQFFQEGADGVGLAGEVDIVFDDVGHARAGLPEQSCEIFEDQPGLPGDAGRGDVALVVRRHQAADEEEAAGRHCLGRAVLDDAETPHAHVGILPFLYLLTCK